MHPAMTEAAAAVAALAALLRERGLEARPGRQGHAVGCDPAAGRVWAAWDHSLADMQGAALDTGRLTVRLDPATGAFVGTVAVTQGGVPPARGRGLAEEREHAVRYVDARALAAELRRCLRVET
jgi:hypothetical protein